MKITYFILVTALLTTNLLAATNGVLLLRSTVSGVYSLTVEPKPLATTLPLDVSQSNSDVGTVKIKANTIYGYKISISSTNSGKLVHESTLTSNIPYSLRFDSRPVSLVSPVILNYPAPQPNANNAKVEITYTGVPHNNLEQGNYSDTVTFTISSL